MAAHRLTVSSPRTALAHGLDGYNLFPGLNQELIFSNCLKLDQNTWNHIMADAQLRIMRGVDYNGYLNATEASFDFNQVDGFKRPVKDFQNQVKSCGLRLLYGMDAQKFVLGEQKVGEDTKTTRCHDEEQVDELLLQKIGNAKLEGQY
ncbi:unnamed protein product [Prunus armeniaca]